MHRMIVLLAVAALPLFASALDAPSRPAEKGCAWEKFASATLGIETWVQRCDFGFRKIDFVEKKGSLAIRYSDGGEPDPLVDVIDLAEEESVEDGLNRVFRAATKKEVADRCVLAPMPASLSRAGVERYTFVLDLSNPDVHPEAGNPDEVREPPCGPLGDQPDGIQYFEVHSSARKILFLRLGQDTPLFDEQTLVVKAE